LDFADFEIIILPDGESAFPVINGKAPVRVIPTGAINPARKRDIGMKEAKGEILAFLDDDAFPVSNWLKCALENLADPLVAAVGGPAVTPRTDSLRQRASGRVFASLLVSGKYIYRYLPRKKQEVDDYPSCNFLVRKNIMKEVGGFNTDFWPGEDTKLCLMITKQLKKKIIYDPTVLVYHHRRELFLPHLRQVCSYALHRGYFVKKFPQTSLRIAYFLPTIFVFGIFFAGAVSLFSPVLRSLYLLGISFYISLVFVFSLSRPLRMVPWVFCGIILTHFGYGVKFLQGLFTPRLKDEP
ncbi:MAG: glycosyltransferase, partial [Candidatus Omnitrophica bacterium]|nr:glycosyltransferase [Candidatus Omnitrophota bacterium]